MLSRKFSFILSSLAITLLSSGSYTSLASDGSARGRVSNQYASGATSANLPHNFFNEPQSAAVRNKPYVPHMTAGSHTRPGSTPPGDALPSHGASSSTHMTLDCPPGHEKGWIIDEGGYRYMILEDGTRIDLEHGGKIHHVEHNTQLVEENLELHKPTPNHDGNKLHGDQRPQSTEEKVEPHKPTPDRLHPLPTPEEEALEAKLKPIEPHIFRRADPNNPTAEKRGEWGKALGDKVYFRVLGIWKYDPSVNATTDIIATGVKDKIKMFEGMAKAQQPKPTIKPAIKPATRPSVKPVPAAALPVVEKPAEAPAAEKPATAIPAAEKPATSLPVVEKPAAVVPAAATTAPPPPPPPPLRNNKPVQKKPPVNIPDALGTTQGRVQSVYTNPTEGKKRQFGIGAPNRAQTGVTGQAIPPADTSETGAAVPPPSGSTTPVD